VAKLTAALGEQLSQEHESRVAGLAQEKRSLQVEVSALRSSASALRVQRDGNASVCRRRREDSCLVNASGPPLDISDPDCAGRAASSAGGPLHEPSVQPEVDDGSDAEPPPEPYDERVFKYARERVASSGGAAAGEYHRGSSMESLRSGSDPWGEGCSPRSQRPSLRAIKSSIALRDPEEETFFQLRGTWMLDEDSIQRLRTKSCMLVVVDQEVEPPANRIMKTIGRIVRSMSMDLEASTGRWIAHPQSTQRVFWDFFTILLVSWDFIMVPLLLFFNVAPSQLIDGIDLATHVFWTLDIPATFMTGKFDGSRLVMRPGPVARRYIRSWLCLDLLIVVPEWIALMLGKSGKVTTSLTALKGLRVVRCLRLLRLVKLEQTLREFQVSVNSNYVILSMGIMKLVVGLVFTNHILACIWYALGNAFDDGWVRGVSAEEAERTGEETPVLHLYFLSLHWSLTQFHASMELVPRNWQERAFAVVVVLFALMTFSSVLSSMTNMVMQLQSLRRDEVKKERILREYLREHQISAYLSARVKMYFQGYVDLRQKKDSEEKLFRNLPVSILTDLHDEARSPIMVAHNLFLEIRNKNERACRHICHECIEELASGQGEVIFTVGDACTRMLFMERGMYTYKRRRMSIGRLFDEDKPSTLIVGAGQWVSEASLYTVWTTFGDFAATESGVCLALDAQAFARVVHQYEETYMQVALYARRFIRYLNNNPVSDIIDSIEWNWACRDSRRFSTSL